MRKNGVCYIDEYFDDFDRENLSLYACNFCSLEVTNLVIFIFVWLTDRFCFHEIKVFLFVL